MARFLLQATLIGIVFMLGSAVARAQTPTPDDTPETPTRTPTPQQVPAAPTGLDNLGGVLRWTDNAGNEDGYRVRIVLRSPTTNDVRRFEFELPPDTERFGPPEEASSSCPDFTSVRWTVVAFNEAGESEPDRAGLELLCPGATATATPGVTLPNTGAGPQGGGIGPLWLLVAVSAFGVSGLAIAESWRRCWPNEV